MTVAELVQQVLEDGQFDATSAQALRWLNVRHKQMCARARNYRKALNLGPTVAGQDVYSIPAAVVEILQVTVGSYVYGAARHTDFAEGATGYLWLGGIGGIAGRDDTASGEPVLKLFPIPTSGAVPEAGAALTVLAAVTPPELAEGDDTTLKIPAEYTDALVAGAIATGLRRMEHRADLATTHEQIFTEGCTELLRATNRRFRGSGPALIRVQGLNA